MGTSAFDPVALADVRSVRNKIDMAGVTADVFAVGDVIRYDPLDDKYLLAQANSEANAAFVGVIESIASNDVTVVYSGEISLPDSLMSTISGATGAQIFYLSDTQKGKLTTTAPSNPASVIKPVIITTGTTDDTSPTLGTVDGIVVNGQSTRISGDSTVDLSDIQPVGSVSAFAGLTADIPAGWEICDGGTLSASTYSDLFASLDYGRIHGFNQQVSLSRTSGDFLTQNLLAGSYFFVSKPGLSGTFRCTIVSGSIVNSIVTAEVSVDPLSSNAEYHNSELAENDEARIYLANGTSTNSFYKVSSSVNPKVNFRKPDLRARFLVGSSKGFTGQQNSAFGTYELGKIGGEEAHTLIGDEMPIHSHAVSAAATLSGNVSVSHSLSAAVAGQHNHQGLYNQPNIDLKLGGSDSVVRIGSNPALLNDGSHAHTVTGNISVSTNNLTPTVSVSAANAGSSVPHNNLPPYMVVYWIIKTRKDSFAKIYKLGPSGGGAIVAKNTAKRWARSTPGAGCTVDVGYGTWGVSYASKGNYVFSHDLLFDLGTADQTKYIVEATVTKSGSGLTQMFVANSYNYGGLTFGVQVYDIIGSTHSDNFQYLNIVVYGGGTAI
jgi:microcystin-dependent protein